MAATKMGERQENGVACGDGRSGGPAATQLCP